MMGLPVSLALLVLAQLNSVIAQGIATIGNSPSSTTRAAATIEVSVGLGNQFQPDVVQAVPGTVIKFIFMPLNHSVVRAE